MPYLLPNGRLISAEMSFELNDITYSSNWLKHSTEQERQYLDITWVDPEPDTSPNPTYVPQIISDRQFFQKLHLAGIITAEEALAAVGPGTIPAALETLISQLPEEQQFATRMLVTGATSFDRNHPLVEAIGSAFGMTSEAIDTFWIEASSL